MPTTTWDTSCLDRGSWNSRYLDNFVGETFHLDYEVTNLK